MVLKGKTMCGVVGGGSIPELFIPWLIDLYVEGVFPFDKLTTTYDFTQINQAIQDQKAGKVLKAVFTVA